MRKAILSGLLTIAIAIPAFADKIIGPSTLKDVQPTGATDKDHKHQAFDLTFDAQGKNYTCRTNPKHSMNPTDFVVGASIHYEIDKTKVKLKTPDNKEVECTVVRVAQIPPGP